jgi:phage-related minor tail protein
MQPVLGFNYGAGLMDRSRRVMLLTVGAASLAAFSEVDSGLDIVEQKTGATGPAAQQNIACLLN